MPNLKGGLFSAIFVAFCVLIAPTVVRAATCAAGYYLKDETCVKCNPNKEPYYCPGDDTRHLCPITDTDYNQFGYFFERGNERAWANLDAKLASDCVCDMFFYDEFGNKFLLESTFNGENYWGRRLLWYYAVPGYYLAGYQWSSSSTDWYSGVKPCTNVMPTYAHYSGPGTPDAPDGSVKDANDCPWECDDGYMLYEPTGKCVLKCEPGYALDSDMEKCVACTGMSYSDAPGATECTPCPTATALKDSVSGYWYWSEDGVHNRLGGCRARFIGYDPRGDYELSCSVCNGDYGVDGSCSRTSCMANLPKSCIGGYRWGRQDDDGSRAVWFSTLEQIKDFTCVPVGVGYYSPDGDTEAHACPAGTSTIGYGPGADEASDCGHALHIGDTTVRLRSEKRTPHTLNVRIGGDIFYGDMSTAPKGKVRIKMGDTVYSVHDDSM